MFDFLHDFIEAALPWVTIAVAIAVVCVSSDAAKNEANKREK